MQLYKANKWKQEQSNPSIIFPFFPPLPLILLAFLSARRGGGAAASFIYTKSDYILRRGPVARDRTRSATKRWVCPHQVPRSIVRVDSTYCVHALFNKAAHNRELAFEMAFVCLRAHNMCRGSKSWCFVILQIKTKQFPFEFINICGRTPQSVAPTVACGDTCPAGCEGLSKAIKRQQ